MHFDPYFCQMESTLDAAVAQDMLSFEAFRNSVIADYKMALMSLEFLEMEKKWRKWP